MPYDLRKSADGYHVFNQATGEDKGVSKTRAKAEAHMRALYANEPRKPSTSPGTMAHGGRMALNDSYRPEPILHGYADGKKVSFADGGVVNMTAGTSTKNPEDLGLAAGAPDKVTPAPDVETVPVKTSAGKSTPLPEKMKKGGKLPLTNIAKTMHKGGLHESLGIPQSEKIPLERIRAAAKRKGKVGKQARLAETFAANRPG